MNISDNINITSQVMRYLVFILKPICEMTLVASLLCNINVNIGWWKHVTTKMNTTSCCLLTIYFQWTEEANMIIFLLSCFFVSLSVNVYCSWEWEKQIIIHSKIIYSWFYFQLGMSTCTWLSLGHTDYRLIFFSWLLVIKWKKERNHFIFNSEVLDHMYLIRTN